MAFADKPESNYELLREGEEVVLRIDYEEYSTPPSLEDSPVCMAKTLDILSEVGAVTKIIFSQKRDYEYDFSQTQMLIEISKIFNKIVKQDIIQYTRLTIPGCNKCANLWYNQLQYVLFRLLKSDPLGAYVEFKRIQRRETIKLQKVAEERCIKCEQNFISTLDYIINMLEKTRLITISKPYLAGYQIGDRSVYKRIFHPSIKPDFMYTKLMATFPVEGEELASYNIGNIEITVFDVPDNIQNLYHVIPPEFKLSEEKYELLDLARKIMAEHRPKKSEFVDPARMRQVFTHVGSDLLDELANYRGIRLKEKELNELTEILVRYTVGFGLIEILLEDEKIQDITINSPMGQIPIFIIHADFDECQTNIVPTVSEAESWASKMRMISGRPLDEANPVLDTELVIPKARARVAVITSPLNPTGIAFAFRRHRDKPWTLPLFITNRMITPLAAGVLSFIIDGSRSILVAGTRSAGKSSLLGSLLVELMRKYRVITVEDTLELPTDALRELGFNIQAMKVAAAMARGTAEVPADEGIRTTLRMGDSVLIVGEVRSAEAPALYEAMRIGAMANVVAGTIHGDSPYGVFDRVVNDLKVPATSFKATDIIVVANPIRSADGLHRWRRVTEITEVRKFWESDPLREGGFSDLFKYESKNDALEPSKDLINGESEIIKSIAGNVKQWAGNWDAVWDNILLRTKTKETLVNVALKTGMMDLLEAKFIIECNDTFHRVSDKVLEDVGFLDSKRIFNDWNEWLTRTVKKQRLS